MAITSSPSLLGSCLIAVAAAAALSACGGGGDSATSPTAPVADAFGPANAAACPRGQVSDVWISNRLACMGAGQQLINNAGGATGIRADRAYILAQTAQDAALSSVLGAGRSRWFKHLLCVRNVPEGVTTVLSANNVGVAIGLGSAVRQSYLPAGVTGSASAIGGGREAAVEAMACSAARNPLIVNYETGRVESINRDALAALTVYDF